MGVPAECGDFELLHSVLERLRGIGKCGRTEFIVAIAGLDSGFSGQLQFWNHDCRQKGFADCYGL